MDYITPEMDYIIQKFKDETIKYNNNDKYVIIETKTLSIRVINIMLATNLRHVPSFLDFVSFDVLDRLIDMLPNITNMILLISNGYETREITVKTPIYIELGFKDELVSIRVYNDDGHETKYQYSNYICSLYIQITLKLFDYFSTLSIRITDRSFGDDDIIYCNKIINLDERINIIPIELSQLHKTFCDNYNKHHAIMSHYINLSANHCNIYKWTLVINYTEFKCNICYATGRIEIYGGFYDSIPLDIGEKFVTFIIETVKRWYDIDISDQFKCVPTSGSKTKSARFI